MEYKIGDKVRIVKRTKLADEYPFGFNQGMDLLVGEVFTIKKIFQTSDKRCSINGDYHRYHLTDKQEWSWHSSMFEPAESSEVGDTAEFSEPKVGDTVRVISKGFEEGNPLLLPSMERFIGGIFKIEEVSYHSSGNHTYRLDGVATSLWWPISALEKVSNDDKIVVDFETKGIIRKISSDDSELIEISDCEISASIYTDSIKIIL